MKRRAWIWLVPLGAAVLGCGPTAEPRFRLNLEGQDRAAIRKEYKLAAEQAMSDAMYAMFGTPNEPYIFPEVGLDLKKLKLAAGPVSSDQQGQDRGLYREHCAHCHGISGDGNGPTSLFLNPYPRDYRKGVFKFTSTEAGLRPTHEDLKKIVQNGIAGSAMPSFKLLPPDEVEALVQYVRYLALRGEVEAELWRRIDDESDPKVILDRAVLDESLASVIDLWNSSAEKVVTPEARELPKGEALAASVAAGRKLFMDDKKGNCVKCHGPTGLGDGGQELFDDWNKDKKPENLHLYSLPVQRLNPRNLRLGIYRGGRRPVDFFRRVHAGIKGTPMPNGSSTLSTQEIWQLVDYVRSLPYEGAEHAAAEPSPGIRANL